MSKVDRNQRKALTARRFTSAASENKKKFDELIANGSRDLQELTQLALRGIRLSGKSELRAPNLREKN